jgi:hypothetical protein
MPRARQRMKAAEIIIQIAFIIIAIIFMMKTWELMTKGIMLIDSIQNLVNKFNIEDLQSIVSLIK